ncbi:TrmH family RNA methyltransferase [Candidatus Dojkabacteria bacterium]|nr:TrmH family RNA methyltransferase [Candidatus Dojkabacteria bacterium]
MSKLGRKYQKQFDYSYTLGVFPTIELLRSKPDRVLEIALSSRSLQNTGVNKIKEICKKNDIKIEQNDKIINNLTKKGNVYAVGFFKKYTSPLETDKNHVVLVNPSDSGNLGTIIRTMLGFDFANLGIIQPGVDIFHPEVIRSSMGSVFKVNFEYFDNFQEYTNKYKNNVYTFMTDGNHNLAGTKFSKLCSLVFGSEGSGLTKEFKGFGQSVKIQQTQNIDSFNLGVSVGIALYQFTREN